MKDQTKKPTATEPVTKPEGRTKEPWAAHESRDEAEAAKKGELGGGKRAQEKELRSRP